MSTGSRSSMSPQRRKIVVLTLIGVALLGAILLFWWQVGGNALDPDAKVDAVFKKYGGTVVREEGKSGRPIIAIVFADDILTDDGLQALAPQLADLKKLRELQLAKTRITDAGLQHLTGLHLQTLTVPGNAQTDEGLRHYLKIVEPPVALHLNHWSITDASLP